MWGLYAGKVLEQRRSRGPPSFDDLSVPYLTLDLRIPALLHRLSEVKGKIIVYKLEGKTASNKY
jgi:hypothetical protein